MKNNTMKKVLSLSLALAMALSLCACAGAGSQSTGSAASSSGSSSTGETGTASEGSTAGETTGTEKNKLAFFLPMTGDQMQYGESLSRGAELALKQYNEKNGTDYVIEIMDDKGDPKEAVNVANLIVSDPTVIAGMGSFSSSCAMAAAPVFEEADLLLFSPNASHTDFPAMGENMFSAVMSQKYEGAEFADALIEMFGAQNVAILYQNTDHGVIATDVFTKQYEAGGGKVIMSETFVPGQTKDFSPVLSKIKEQDPALFYVNASYNDCAQIFMQAKALNMDCQLVGPGMLLTEEFLDVVGNKIDGTIVMSSVPAFLPSVLESGELDEASKNFVDSYTSEYNEVPDGFAASAFDAVNIVLDAVAKVGTDTPALREELTSDDMMLTVDGKLYGWPSSRENPDWIQNAYYCMFAHRRDWAQAVGMYKEGDAYTWDEVKAMIKAVQEQDPGNNGAGNTIGITSETWAFPGVFMGDPGLRRGP